MFLGLVPQKLPLGIIPLCNSCYRKTSLVEMTVNKKASSAGTHSDRGALPANVDQKRCIWSCRVLPVVVHWLSQLLPIISKVKGERALRSVACTSIIKYLVTTFTWRSIRALLSSQVLTMGVHGTAEEAFLKTGAYLRQGCMTCQSSLVYTGCASAFLKNPSVLLAIPRSNGGHSSQAAVPFMRPLKMATPSHHS